MKYAVIKSGSKQYRVSEGEEVVVDRILSGKTGDKYDFRDVLLIKDGDNVAIGNPNVTDGSVRGKIIEELKGDKIDVYKFKAKVRYRRHTGFRSHLSKILIETISLGKPAKTTSAVKPVSNPKAKKVVS